MRKKNNQFCSKCGADLCVLDNVIEIEVSDGEMHCRFRCAKCGTEVVLTKKKEKKA